MLRLGLCFQVYVKFELNYLFFLGFCFKLFARVAAGLRNFRLPSLCLPFGCSVVLFMGPSCHVRGGSDLQQHTR